MKYILPQFNIPSIVQCSGFHQPKLFLTFIISHYKITFRSFFFRKTNHFSPIQRKTNTKEYNWSLLKSDDNRAIIVARYLLFIYIYYKPSIGKVFNYLKKLDNDWSFWVFIEYKYKLANEKFVHVQDHREQEWRKFVTKEIADFINISLRSSSRDNETVTDSSRTLSDPDPEIITA